MFRCSFIYNNDSEHVIQQISDSFPRSSHGREMCHFWTAHKDINIICPCVELRSGVKHDISWLHSFGYRFIGIFKACLTDGNVR